VKKKNIVFVLSSGRSGTNLLANALKVSNLKNIYHEFNLLEIQILSTKYDMGIYSFDKTKSELKKKYFNHIDSCIDDWIDVSNKLTWIADILLQKYPDAKFVELIRNGKSVVSSFYYKLDKEMYTNKGVKALQAYADGLASEPPHTKEYWWSLAKNNKKMEYVRGLNRFELCCHHWKNTHTKINEFKQKLSNNNFFQIKLEELVSSRDAARRLINFIGLKIDIDSFCEIIKKPINVYKPVQYILDDNQIKCFEHICGSTMSNFDYDLKKNPKIKY